MNLVPHLMEEFGGKPIDETPVTAKSKLLAEDVKLYYAGRELHVDRIECPKLSLAVYFTAASGSRENIFDIIYGIASKALLNFGSENRKCPAGKGKSLKVNFQTFDWMPAKAGRGYKHE